ncbi:hypothetical protein J6590_106625, partial [Homalodisca vitripennis]
KEEKKGKKRGHTFPKAAWSLVQVLSLQRMQVPSTSHEYERHNHTSHHRREGFERLHSYSPLYKSTTLIHQYTKGTRAVR